MFNKKNIMKDVFHLFDPHFQKHHKSPNVEIEFRLGKRSNGFFDTNVGEEIFNQCKQALDKCNQWESVTEKEYEIYSTNSGRRTIIDQDDTRTHEYKKKIDKIDFSDHSFPFDIRMGISSEIPIPEDELNEEDVFDDVKTKKRFSYLRKGLRIDISIVTGNPDDLDDENDTAYQVEFEIVDPSNVQTRDALYNHIYKIKDLFKCLKL
jgi:hypothetical protein